MTPAQAWAACEHRPVEGTPIPHSDLIATALAYKEQAAADRAKPGDGLTVEDPQHTSTGRLLEVSAEVVITRANPQIYLHGRIIKVPVHLVGAYMPVITNTDYMLFNTEDGAESIGFPLPVETKAGARKIPLWQVAGARIRDPKPDWTQKHLAYEAEHYPASSPITDESGLSPMF